MLRRIQYLGRGQRIVVFALLMVGGLLLLGGITVFLILLSVNTAPRSIGTALQPNVTVTEFAQLPDDDAYPSTVTASGGTIYTGSYATGAVWSISSTGEVQELPGTRDAIGSITGLEAASDGTVYIFDRVNSDPRTQGGLIWRYTMDGTLTQFADIEDETGFVASHHLALDGEGRLYATDRGRREIWRWNADGTGGELWWRPDENQTDVIPTGIAYDPVNQALIVSDSETDTLFRIPLESATAEVIYDDTSTTEEPDFNGVVVAADGTIYVTALSLYRIAALQNGTLTYLAGGFRGPSDIAIGGDGAMYVSNFDSSALVVPGVSPQVPFALDVVRVTGEIAAPTATP
jgi:DNA-binding beta-propeller fold protein YncE